RAAAPEPGRGRTDHRRRTALVTSEVLAESAVVVGATAPDQGSAIDLVGSILVAQGCATNEYVAQMREREKIVSTYLGNGIALPHGTNESKESVVRTGLAVAPFPEGGPRRGAPGAACGDRRRPSTLVRSRGRDTRQRAARERPQHHRASRPRRRGRRRRAYRRSW